MFDSGAGVRFFVGVVVVFIVALGALGIWTNSASERHSEAAAEALTKQQQMMQQAIETARQAQEMQRQRLEMDMRMMEQAHYGGSGEGWYVEP